MATQRTLIQSVSRALALLDAVGGSARPVTAKCLARQSGLALPTAYHLLRTLVHDGYLAREEGGYVLGDRALSLAGGRAVGMHPAHSHQILEHLRDELHAPAYLSVLDDGEIRLADVADSRSCPRVDMWVGFHHAAHATALGKAVLSTLPDRARRDYVAAHELADLTPHTVTSPPRLLRELDSGSDVALDREEFAVGTACVAVAVPSPTFAAAVAVSVRADQLGRVLERGDAIRRAARLIAYAGAGERPDPPVTI
ncbi:IclR family transcriptional regulator [Nocardioides salarius]|uniref:IclR family transcriptional regulator n=1 Tax=Nocardioides salarius TaxID=374513 RepID=UPI0030F59C85